jgi:hypothetical protein
VLPLAQTGVPAVANFDSPGVEFFLVVHIGGNLLPPVVANFGTPAVRVFLVVQIGGNLCLLDVSRVENARKDTKSLVVN